jgi:hypothetical protein
MKHLAYMGVGAPVDANWSITQRFVDDNQNILLLLARKGDSRFKTRVVVYTPTNYAKPAVVINITDKPDLVLQTPEAWYVYGRQSKWIWRIPLDNPSDFKAYTRQARELKYTETGDGICVYGWNPKGVFTLWPSLTTWTFNNFTVNNAVFENGFWALTAQRKGEDTTGALVILNASNGQKRVLKTPLPQAEGVKIIGDNVYAWGNMRTENNVFYIVETQLTTNRTYYLIHEKIIAPDAAKEVKEVFRVDTATFFVGANGVFVLEGFSTCFVGHLGLKRVHVVQIDNRELCATVSPEAICFWDWRADGEHMFVKEYPCSVERALEFLKRDSDYWHGA